MEKARVLIVTQEMNPYLNLSEISKIARSLPQHIQEKGMEIRILMPRFGDINERRHRLHEVVRLSGINITVADEDYPLIIKVASLPNARMQVYFLDNEDLFKRKGVFANAKGEPFEDNAERMTFFCKGVLETVKKFGWPPNIIHCHGWMTGLIPYYLKTNYKDDPVFNNSKAIFSVYNDLKGGVAPESLQNIAELDDENYPVELEFFNKGDVNSLNAAAASCADGVIIGSDKVDATDLLAKNGKPILEFQGEEDYLAAYHTFYNDLLSAVDSK
ncbi:MAG: glycogen/starch synthase [Chitinophagales bacterium]